MSTSDTLTGARTMWELVDRRAQASPNPPMLIAADGETVTFGAFRDRAERVAAGLQGMGVTTGSVVSWQLPTRIDTVVLSIALSRLGAVQNPIIHLYREREVGFALRQTGASLFVIPGTWRDVDFGAIADLALAGAPIVGCYRSYRPGHKINAMMLSALFADRKAFEIVDGAARKPYALGAGPIGRVATAYAANAD